MYTYDEYYHFIDNHGFIIQGTLSLLITISFIIYLIARKKSNKIKKEDIVETNSYGEVKTVCDKWAKQMIEAPLNVIEKDADIKQCMCCEKKVEYSTGIFTCKDCSI